MLHSGVHVVKRHVDLCLAGVGAVGAGGDKFKLKSSHFLKSVTSVVYTPAFSHVDSVNTCRSALQRERTCFYRALHCVVNKSTLPSSYAYQGCRTTVHENQSLDVIIFEAGGTKVCLGCALIGVKYHEQHCRHGAKHRAVCYPQPDSEHHTPCHCVPLRRSLGSLLGAQDKYKTVR